MKLNLLSNGDKNAKLAKSSKRGIATYGLSLAPHTISGNNVCPEATAGCKADCIFTSGNGRFPNVLKGRTRKTKLLFSDRAEFLRQLRADIDKIWRNCNGASVAIRLNVFSDLPWENIADDVFECYPAIQFYDYTKIRSRYRRWLNGELPRNYHLTFSRSETNENDALEFLSMGGTVAVPFYVTKDTALPPKWRGFNVIDGDDTDLRYLDSPGCVVGLKAKGTGRSDKVSGFIVRDHAGVV